MEDKLLSKEISEDRLRVSSTLRHISNSLQNTTFDLFKPHVLSAIDNIREKKKHPDVDSIFKHIVKSSATNIDRDVVESMLIELINQDIISNKKTNYKLGSFSQCLIKNASCQSNNEHKSFETLQDNVKFLQKELAA